MKVRYTIDSLLHLAAIHSYIHERNPVAATRVIDRVRTAVHRLGDNPRAGRTGALSGTREWVVTGLPYIVVYELYDASDELIVLGVYHGAQIRPGQEVT